MNLKTTLGVLSFSLLTASVSHAGTEVPAQLRSATEVLTLALAEPLQYAGQFVPYDSLSKIPNCIFKNSKVMLVYNYCRKREAPAVSIYFFGPKASDGYVSLYAEGNNGEPASQLKRKDYSRIFWRVSSHPNIEGYDFKMSPKKMQNYHMLLSKSYLMGCFVSQKYVEPMVDGGPMNLHCGKNYESQRDSWIPGAYAFWKEPTDVWYQIQHQLRDMIDSNPEIQ